MEIIKKIFLIHKTEQIYIAHLIKKLLTSSVSVLLIVKITEMYTLFSSLPTCYYYYFILIY